MRITFELDPDDVVRFREALARAHRMAECADECDIIDAAKQALDRLAIGDAPGYVRKRIVRIQQLILMLEDEAWALPPDERRVVAETLVYFSDPEDMIPDEVSVIGLLDDAIMLELLLRRIRHVLQAYDDFRCFRAGLETEAGSAGRIAAAGKLAAKRTMLHARMRRRTQRDAASVVPTAATGGLA